MLEAVFGAAYRVGHGSATARRCEQFCSTTKRRVYKSDFQLRARHRNFTYIVPSLPILTTCLDYLRNGRLADDGVHGLDPRSDPRSLVRAKKGLKGQESKTKTRSFFGVDRVLLCFL